MSTIEEYMKYFLKLRKRVITFFKKHVEFNALTHALGGVGLGIIIASPIAGTHPIRWGIAFLIISLLGHLYSLWKS